MYAIISQIYENILGAGTIQPGCLAPADSRMIES